MRVILRMLAKEEKKRHVHWPDASQYQSLLDYEVVKDGAFEQKIDIYYAKKDSNRKNQVVIDIHGGAYLFGNRKHNFWYASFFLEKGYDVVLMDYRPNGHGRGCLDQVHDLAAELCYLNKHAEELGLNKDAFFLTGDSAGGHYSLLMAEASCDIVLQQQLGIDLGGIAFRGVAVCCPVYDFVRCVNTERLSNRGKKFMYGPKYKDEAYVKLLSPKEHLSSLKIPLFLTSCHNDFIKEESLDLHKDALESGHDITYLFIENQDSAVGHVHNVIDLNHPESKTVNEAIASFFARCAE